MINILTNKNKKCLMLLNINVSTGDQNAGSYLGQNIGLAIPRRK